MIRLLFLFPIVFMTFNAYAIDLGADLKSVSQEAGCSVINSPKKGELIQKACLFENTSLKDAYNNVMKEYAVGIKDYPKDIPSKEYNRDGLYISRPEKNRVSIDYFNGLYYFTGVLIYDEQNKSVNSMIMHTYN